MTAPAAAAAPGLAISNPWIRFIVPGVPAAGYFTLTNSTATPATLIAASSPGCGKLMLHRSVSNNGRDSMNAIEKVVVPAHQKLAFTPGDYHLMCTAPSAEMKHGATIPVTLKFAGGSTMTASFPVRDATGH